MKAYRIVVEIKDPIHSPTTYMSPRIFLGLPFKVAYRYEQEFIAHCRILFNTEEHVHPDNQEVRSYYKEYEIHPFRDLFHRTICLFKYGM